LFVEVDSVVNAEVFGEGHVRGHVAHTHQGQLIARGLGCVEGRETRLAAQTTHARSKIVHVHVIVHVVAHQVISREQIVVARAKEVLRNRDDVTWFVVTCRLRCTTKFALVIGHRFAEHSGAIEPHDEFRRATPHRGTSARIRHAHVTAVYGRGRARSARGWRGTDGTREIRHQRPFQRATTAVQ
jgi:hypothetical protein